MKEDRCPWCGVTARFQKYRNCADCIVKYANRVRDLTSEDRMDHVVQLIRKRT